MFKKVIRNASGKVGVHTSTREIVVPEGGVELTGQELADFLASDKNPDRNMHAEEG